MDFWTLYVLFLITHIPLVAFGYHKVCEMFEEADAAYEDWINHSRL